MTTEEAIKGLKAERDGFRKLCPESNLVTMHQLGIEALERIQDARENPQGCTHWYRLPSEGEANE